MSKIISTKINAGFLAIVLIVGTFAAISPSFMVGAHAQQYGMDQQKYNSYEPDYGMDNSYDDKKSYGKDSNSYDKSKDSSTIVKKIKCNNINANVNGFNGVEVGTLPTALSDLATDDEAKASDEGEVGTNSFGSNDGESSGSDTDSRFVCINHNDFTTQTNSPDAEDANLIVTKVVTCESEGVNNRACSQLLAGLSGGATIIQSNDFNIAISGNHPTPSQFDGSSFPTIVTLGPGGYQVSETADPSVATSIIQAEALSNSDISQSVIFSGDCDAVTGQGTIAEGELQICSIENAFTARPPPDAATTGTTTTQSNNPITTTTTTQSSNLGVPQSSNIVNSTSSSSPSSTLVNILPSSPN